MSAKNKKIGLVAIVILVIGIIGILVTNYILKQKLEQAIRNLPKHKNVTYSSLSANILTGNVSLESPEIKIIGETTDTELLNIKASKFTLNGFSLFKFLTKDDVQVDAIELDSPIINYKHNSKVKQNSYSEGFFESIKDHVTINEITIKNADVLIHNVEKDSIMLSLPKCNFTVNNVEVNPETSDFSYANFKFTGNDLKYVLNDYDNLTVKSLECTNTEALFNEVDMKTKYTKEKLSTLLKTERDHVITHYKSIAFEGLNVDFGKAQPLNFQAEKLTLNTPSAEIFRDKLLPDNFDYKPLYSKMLRDLDFKLGLNLVEITNGTLKYTEKINYEKEPGSITFHDLNAKITNLGNIFGDAETQIDIACKFMEDASLKVDWNFKVSDTTDAFVFKGDLGTMQVEKINQFIKPNLKVKLQGVLDQTYFSIYGNDNLANSDLKIKYDGFEIAILNENGNEKRNLLSSLVNLIISNDTKKETDHFRYGQAENLPRDKTKSIFNLLWNNIKQGLLSAMAGNGKKDRD